MVRRILAFVLIVALTGTWVPGLSVAQSAAKHAQAVVEGAELHPMPADGTSKQAPQTTDAAEAAMAAGCPQRTHGVVGANCILGIVSNEPVNIVAREGHRSVWRSATGRLTPSAVSLPLRPPILLS